MHGLKNWHVLAPASWYSMHRCRSTGRWEFHKLVKGFPVDNTSQFMKSKQCQSIV